MKRPIAIGLSPNLFFSDVLLAIKLLFSPWSYFQTSCISQLEQWFRHYFSRSYAVSFVSGRGALYAALKVLRIHEGDEVIIQAFTCVAVPNAIIFSGAKPIYADCTDGLGIDSRDVERKITKKTKAIIVQHTFGIPAELEKISTLAKKNKLFLIEDCAHTVGGEFEKKKLGTFSDIAIFSFGRDKAFSSVFGGMAITNSETYGKKLRALQKDLGSAPFFFVVQQLLHPIFSSVILPLYDIWFLGKVLLVLLQKLHLVSFPVSNEEKHGKTTSLFAKKMPNQLACLAYEQLRHLSRYNAKRKEAVSYYLSHLNLSYGKIVDEDAPLLRFPLLVKKRDTFVHALRKKHIYLGMWYSNVIDPIGVNFHAISYTPGSCLKAEALAKEIVNLPTYPTLTRSEQDRVIHELVPYVQL